MLDELSLFLYGAFSQGMVLAHHFDRYVIERKPAQVKGLVYRLPAGYPAFVAPASDGSGHAQVEDLVPGEIARVQGPELVFRLLDELNGFFPLAPQKSLCVKQRIMAQTHDGVTECFVYAFNPAKLPKASERIVGGDWRSDLSNRPTLAQTLTEKQATYIKRLSQCSGREVIPIDMTLYRELLKLELIVDKGRRLALTPLGKDVARFL